MLASMSETVVVGYDGQEHSDRALDRAIETVKAAGGKVVVVVAEEMPPVAYEATTAFGTAYDASMFELQTQIPDPDKPFPGVQEILDRATERLAGAGVEGESTWAIGDPAQVIVDAAREHGASKIIVGGHAHGFFARVFSEDIGAEVERDAQCDVIVVD
jgi:nucleotide-binding universal stress UspA family protein